MISLSIACAVACACLVAAEWRGIVWLRAVAKTAASIAFLGVAVLAGRRSDGYAIALLCGLALGVVGDIALLGKSDRAFLVGLAAFLLGHVAYIVAVAQLVSPTSWLTSAGFAAALPIAVGAIALASLWPRLGSMRVPVIAYVLAIVVMVIGALATSSNRLSVGAVLFFASDLAVARDKFVGRAFANKAWGLPAYYAAQLSIAWTLAES